MGVDELECRIGHLIGWLQVVHAPEVEEELISIGAQAVPALIQEMSYGMRDWARKDARRILMRIGEDDPSVLEKALEDDGRTLEVMSTIAQMIVEIDPLAIEEGRFRKLLLAKAENLISKENGRRGEIEKSAASEYALFMETMRRRKQGIGLKVEEGEARPRRGAFRNGRRVDPERISAERKRGGIR